MPVLFLWQFLFRHGQRVIHSKVVDNDRDRHGDGEHARQGTQGSDQHSRSRLRVHVSVAQGRHGHHCPPESNRDVFEVCVVAGSRVVGVGSYPFGVVDHSGKYEDTQSEEDDKEEELVGTGSQCVAQHPQSYKVTRQLKDTQDPNKADHSQETQHVLSCLGGEATETHFQVEGQDGHEVDDVEGVPNEVELIWAESYSHEKFKGEPHHTHALYVGEVGGSLSLLVDVLHCHIVHQLQLGAVDDGVEGLVGLQTEGGDGHQDEEQ